MAKGANLAPLQYNMISISWTTNKSPPCLKSAQPFRFLILHRHIFHHSSRRTLMTPINHFLNSWFIPFKHRFHSTIGQISHPTIYTPSTSFTDGWKTIANPLNLSRNENVSADLFLWLIRHFILTSVEYLQTNRAEGRIQMTEGNDIAVIGELGRVLLFSYFTNSWL